MSAAQASPARNVARWRYVLPNAITCVSLLLGLAAIVNAFRADHLEAAWLIVLCVLLDKADGTVARLLRATSRIGSQLDSFSDFVTFGIAPACIIFARLESDPTGAGAVWAGDVARWGLYALLAAYVLCACIRLAKFNVLQDVLPDNGPKVFYGLPSTFAGGLFVVIYIIGEEYGATELIRWLPVIGGVFAAAMVSNLPLPKLAWRESMPLNVLQLANVALGYTCGIFRIWPEYILGAVSIYAVVGFTWGFIHREDLMPRRLDPYPE